MTNIELIPFNVFVIVTTFTPGPGNIASAGMGLNYGYRRTLKFLIGITIGYLSVMTLSAFLSSSLIQYTPSFEPVLRTLGTLYILWLAYGTAKASYDFSPGINTPLNFRHGFLIQALNPKAVIFGLTIYTTFLSGLNSNPLFLSSSILYLTALTFLSVSFWTFGGTRIRAYLHIPQVRKWSNIVLTLLLIYCAYTLSGISFYMK